MNAGLWGKTLVETTGPVALRDPYVATTVGSGSADLSVYVDAVNATAAPVTTTVTGTITKTGYPTLTVNQDADTGGQRTDRDRVHAFARPQSGAVVAREHGQPRAVSPRRGGHRERNDLGQPRDRLGVRQFTDYRTTVNGTSFAGYRINGQNVFFKGAGYVWDLLQRWDTKTNAAHVQYVKDMGLNTIRLEGTLGNEELYDLADRAGIMIMPGFVCCSAWENDSGWSTEQTQVAQASLESQMRALRAHASPFVWAFGSDMPPTAAHLTAYKNIATALALAESHAGQRRHVVQLQRRREDGRPLRLGAAGAVVGHDEERKRIRHHGRGRD
jgi:exo-1,4-beta-D-glucosaminidase